MNSTTHRNSLIRTSDFILRNTSYNDSITQFSRLLQTPLLPERHSHVFQQRPCLIIIGGRGHDGDVHALHAVDLGVVNLRKDQLVAQAKGKIAAPVKALAAHATKVAHAGQGHIDETIEELVHAVSTQRHHGADRHALAHLEGSNRFLGPGDHRLLPGNLAQLVHRRVQHLGVLGGLANPMFTTILCNRGTAIGFFSSNSFMSAGATSFWNFSFSRAVIFLSAISSAFLSRSRSGYRCVNYFSFSSFQFPVAAGSALCTKPET